MKSCTQNFSKLFIKRKRQYQYKIPAKPFAIQNSKKSHRVIKKVKSKVPVDDINVSALILMIWISF